jgi:hypothetical protein
LIALWLRSQTVRDSGFFPRNTFGIEINSIKGHVVLFIAYQPFIGGETIAIRHEKITPNDEARVKRGILGFFYYSEPQSSQIHVPFWFLALAIITTGAAPWIRWSRQFTLRTLLIGLTVTAVALGVAVLASN